MNETGYQTGSADHETADEARRGPGAGGAPEDVDASTTPVSRWWRALPWTRGGAPGGEGSGGDTAVATPDDEVDDGVPGTGGGGSPTPPPRWRRALPWALVVLAVAAAATSTWQWQQLAAEERARDEVAQSAGTFMLTLTNWDATEGMGDVREELRTHGTQRFAGEVEELFGTTEDLRELAEVGARSDGEVRRFFVQDLDGDRAVALVVLVQRLTTDVTEGEEVSVRYAELDLLQHDSEWLIDEVELLADVAQQEAEPIAPGTEDTQEAP